MQIELDALKINKILIGIYHIQKNILKQKNYGFKKILSDFGKEKINLNNAIFFKLFSIAKKYENKKIKYYLNRWFRQRKVNLFHGQTINNIITKTSIIPQIALWRMIIYKKKRRKKLNPLKFLACVKIRRLLQKKLEEQRIHFLFQL